jgi:hypothetical protein
VHLQPPVYSLSAVSTYGIRRFLGAALVCFSVSSFPPFGFSSILLITF